MSETGKPHIGVIIGSARDARFADKPADWFMGLAGKLFAATGDGRTGYVTRVDCARAAAAALMNETGKKVLNVTGPTAVSQADVAAILSEEAGKDIPYVPMEANALVQAMVGNGMPEFMARVFVSFDQAIAQGYLEVVSDDLKALTGQAGQSVRDFLMANKGALLSPPQH